MASHLYGVLGVFLGYQPVAKIDTRNLDDLLDWGAAAPRTEDGRTGDQGI
jgi:hypothetical protein